MAAQGAQGLAITKQRATVDSEVGRVSANICEDLEPEYMDIVDDLATMLLKVADASERARGSSGSG